MPISRPKAWHPLRVVLLSSVVLLVACSDKPDEQQAQAPGFPVSVVTVQSQPTTLFAELPGRVEAIKEAQIRARVTGIVDEINFQQGSDVKEGELLFSIDPDTYEAQRDQLAAQVENAIADSKVSASLSERYTRLIKENAVSRQEYENAMARNAQAQAAITAARANLKAAEINLSYTKVVSPISGRIGRSEITEGALVSSTEGTHLATVQQLDRVYVDVTRPASELHSLRKAVAEGKIKQDADGAKVRALLDDGTTYDEIGSLLFSGVAVDPGTGQVSLRAEFPNPDHLLLPGMFVRVRIDQGVDENALLVPTQAIQYSSSGATSVMVVNEGVVAAVPVQVGANYGDRIIVTQGLESGAQVIVEGFQKIGPGSPVEPKPWKDDEAAQGQDGAPGSADPSAAADVPEAADSSSDAANASATE
ncbi:efflux RND transporter periplasmic adaptor subunit [Paenalcaligenes niemegkensis]|uniref:efflux RND transporter periplasmic adaptor subunit n=1 Tax=Paenalcaligenes niemegkensis TaxID=2895469 RepID=UPI001EE7CE13|nr:efflux RND transporter periplasmic adaptor subunit [Paenalcaligenes niemegkensis]MCQ9616266.1 efflux RND transporter periplasmic adaptor subunit [Paenalcaligenes niemegkensis]